MALTMPAARMHRSMNWCWRLLVVALVLVFFSTGGVNAAAYTARVADASSISRPSAVRPVADGNKIALPSISEDCKKAASWAELNTPEANCIVGRERILFRDVETKRVGTGRSAQTVTTAAPRSAPLSAVLPSLPPLEPTLEEQEAQGKANALRQLENDQRLDVERDLRDFLNAQ